MSYSRCRACGALCDGDLCDWICEQHYRAECEARQRADRADRGVCLDCGDDPCECDPPLDAPEPPVV